MNFQFPQYRKLKNGLSYYHLENNAVLHEAQMVGQRWTIHRLEAKILPERNLVSDLLHCIDGAYEVIDASTFNDFITHCEAHLKRF